MGRVRRGLLIASCAAAAAVSATTPAHARTHELDAVSLYGASGSWLDIFASPVTWSRPRQTVAALSAHGVQTLYLETGNYSQHVDLVRPRLLGQWIDAAHAVGMSVVAWYLPSLSKPATDLRRALAAVHFRSASGGRFDGFALDIEASLVPLPLRNRRLLGLAAAIRRTVPESYPLGAIIPSPVGMDRHPRYWPSFPYRRLGASFDAFLPMAYFSYYEHTPQDAYDYTRRVVQLLRQRAGEDVLIHVIGGLANRITPAEAAAFARAATDCRVGGFSLYAFLQTSDAEWAALTGTASTIRSAACD